MSVPQSTQEEPNQEAELNPGLELVKESSDPQSINSILTTSNDLNRVNIVNVSEQVNKSGQNTNTILCQYCPSIILNPETVNFVKMDFSLPFMTKKRGAYDFDKEDLSEYWSVDDMFTFENAGFTNTTENVKYLGCADCEIGPIGYVNLETKVSYVALSRVRYQ